MKIKVIITCEIDTKDYFGVNDAEDAKRAAQAMVDGLTDWPDGIKIEVEPVTAGNDSPASSL